MQSPERMSQNEPITQIKQTAERGTQEARGVVRDQIDQRSTEVGRRIREQAQSMRKLSDQLRGEGQTMPAEVVERAIEPAERLGAYLETVDGEQILRDAEEFARRKPWVVAGAAFVLGTLGARFLKASSSTRTQTQQYTV